MHRTWLAICSIGFLGFCFVPNPIDPGVCSSRGWGIPFAVFASWCECFLDENPSAFRIKGVVIDLCLWALIYFIGLKLIRLVKSAPCRPEPFN